MFVPQGFSGGELGDVEVVVRGGELHLFHLCLPSHDVVGHAVSTDGIRFRPVEPAIHTGAPGRFDDDQIWTVSVTEVNGRYHMLYTALCRAESGLVQRVGLAISDDLMRWEKVGDAPVSEADPRLYETGGVSAPWTAWRDPKPTHVDGRYHSLVCARGLAGPALRRGVVGHFVSDDGLSWTAEPPLFAPHQHYELECPQLFCMDGRYYLTAAILEERAQRYWVADSLAGPFRTPDDNRLTPEGHYAARICRVGDEHLLFCFHDVPGDSDEKTAWRERFVPSPLRLSPGPDGALLSRPHRGWEAYRRGAARPLSSGALEAIYDNPRASRNGTRLSCEEGLELWTHPQMPQESWLEGRVPFDAPLLVLAYGAGADGSGVFVELDRGAGEARVVTVEPTRAQAGAWIARRVLQRGRLVLTDAPLLSVRHVASELELSVDDRVVLSTRATSGPGIGVGIVSGQLDVGQLAVTAVAVP